MREKKEEQDCLYYCWGGYCNRNYSKERKAFGWSSVIEYKCKKKCYLFKKNTWYNRLLLWLFR